MLHYLGMECPINSRPQPWQWHRVQLLPSAARKPRKDFILMPIKYFYMDTVAGPCWSSAQSWAKALAVTRVRQMSRIAAMKESELRKRLWLSWRMLSTYKEFTLETGKQPKKLYWLFYRLDIWPHINLQSVLSSSHFCISCHVILQVELWPKRSGVHAHITDRLTFNSVWFSQGFVLVRVTVEQVGVKWEYTRIGTQVYLTASCNTHSLSWGPTGGNRRAETDPSGHRASSCHPGTIIKFSYGLAWNNWMRNYK